MSEVAEIQQIVDHLQGVLENLITRGLAAAGSAERNALATLGDEFARIGATHLAERARELREAIENQRRDSATRLLKTQASLRLFERVLTLEVARGSLTQWHRFAAAEESDEPDPD
jgi:hypothetical protein